MTLNDHEDHFICLKHFQAHRPTSENIASISDNILHTNRKVCVACSNHNYRVKTGGRLKVTCTHVHYRSSNISETVYYKPLTQTDMQSRSTDTISDDDLE